MKSKKRALTLLEIIVVIFIITLVTGAVGYNMKGSLDKGRAFRTEQGRQQLQDLLLMCVAEGDSIRDVASDPVGSLKRHGLAKNPQKLVEDGWGNPFMITLNKEKNDFIIKSKSFEDYQKKKGKVVDSEEEP